jgi:hypothetical protein
MRRGRDQGRTEAGRPGSSLTAVQIRWLIGFFVLTRADRSKAGVHGRTGARHTPTFQRTRALLPPPHGKMQ